MYWFLFLFIAWGIALVMLLQVVLKHKTKPFFIHRSIPLMIITQISILIASIIIAVSTLIPPEIEDKFCVFLNCTYCVLLPICLLTPNLMTPSLIIKSKLNRKITERSQGIKSSLWRLRHLTSTKAKLIIIAITCIVQVILYFIIQYTANIQGDCQLNSLYPFVAVLCFYLIPITINGYRLLDVDDPHSIRLEILITTIFSMPSMFGVILFIANKLPFALQYVFLYALVVIFLCNLALPVFIEMRRPMLSHDSNEDLPRLLKENNTDPSYASLIQYSSKNYVLENIYFYQKVEDYKLFPTNEKAKEIFDEYIEYESPMQINIIDSIYQHIKNNLDTSSPTLFDKAQNAIKRLIIESIVPQWRREPTTIEL